MHESRFHAVLPGILISLFLVMGCRSDRHSPPSAPRSTNQPGVNSETRAAYDAVDFLRSPALNSDRPPGRKILIELSMEGGNCICMIDHAKIGVLPRARKLVFQRMEMLISTPESTVVVLDISPRVPHTLVSALVSDCTKAGLTRLTSAKPDSPF